MYLAHVDELLHNTSAQHATQHGSMTQVAHISYDEPLANVLTQLHA